MHHETTDSPIVTWRLWEPPYLVELSENALVQHTLLLGSTGSGKSTLLIDAARQLIAHNAQNSDEKIGLLILDAKCDDLAALVRDAALRAGRADDVLLFGPGGDCGFDLFGGLRSLDDVERLTRQVLLGTEKFGGDNAYWWHSTQAMLSAAFALLVSSGKPITFESTVRFLRGWFLSPTLPPLIEKSVQQISRRGGRRPPLLATALDQVSLWQALDPKTRSNLQSCLVNVMRPLLSPAAAKCFNVPATTASPAEAATAGKICLVSVNAMTEPDLAQFFFRLAKQTFFESVQQRAGGPRRLCGLIADEFPLVVTREDVEQLATIRSKRCFVLAASQGINALSERLGLGQSHALVNNFNTLVFMRSREAETAVHAFVTLGTRQQKRRRQKPPEGGLLELWPPPSDEPVATEVPVCPLGALGQLDAHQAFIVLHTGKRTESPVWFAPWFELAPSEATGEQSANSATFSSGHVLQLMLQAKFKQVFSAHVVEAAAKVWSPRKGNALERAREFFRVKACRIPDGLEKLPECWLAALPGILWRMRKPGWTHLPFFIDRLAFKDGVLLLGFAQEQPNPEHRLTAWDKIRVAVNASLYPARWRPLSRRHVLALCRAWPDLRPSLNPESPTLT